MKFASKLLLLLLLVSKFSFAQKVELINSGDLLNKSIELADSSKFKEAMTLLNKVNRSDTNYVNVLLRKALICLADSQYNDGVKYCQQALLVKSNHDLEADIYTIHGNLLLNLQNYDGALKVFETGIEKFPANSLMYFNKGVVYLRKEKPELAETWFQKALIINPYMYTAHYHLGLAAIVQGKVIPAYISYMSYLLFSPQGKYAKSALNTLQQISVGTDEIIKLKNDRKSYPNANYQAVEDILFSKIALNKSYIPLTEIDDPISRQIQAVIEKIEYSDEDQDFWIQYYVPFLKKTYDDKKFDLFIHHIFSNVDIPAITNYVEKNKKQIDNYTNGAAEYFDPIRGTREIMLKRRDTVTNRYFYEKGVLLGKGQLSKTGKTLLGAWEGYYPGGNIKSKGMYSDAGQRTGSWTWFNMNGSVKSRENFLNGKLNGEQEYYYFNGNKSSTENYANGELQGLSTVYYYGGSKKTTVNYKDGKLDGEERDYYISGDLSTLKNFVAGQLNGTEKEYFKNGKLQSEAQYLNGKVEGIFKQYNKNGVLIATGNFSKDLTNGEWKYFDNDGKLNKLLQKRGGVENGLHQEYFPNGQLSATYNVDKDKINGELLEYYRNGKVLSKRTYLNGVITQAEYLDQNGRQLSALIKNGENSKLVLFDHNGYKKASLNYNKSGQLNGADTIYYNSGKINQICNYVDGVLQGKIITYYQSGKIKSETSMVDDETDGYYTSYYMNGKVESEGWMVAGDNQGLWFYYNENGTLNISEYFLNDEIDGYKEEFGADGKKTTEYKYYTGWLEETTNYDAQGKIIATDVFPKGQGKFRLMFPDGKLMSETNYKNGEFDGLFKSYFFDGSLQRTSYYKAGQLDSTYVLYQHGGLKSMEGKYNNGGKEGLWKFYDEDGKLYRTSVYGDNSLNGEYILYYPNGNKKFVSQVKDDLFQGYGKTYDVSGALVCQILYQDDLAIAYTFNDSSGKLKEETAIAPLNGLVKSFFANGKPSRECTYVGGERHGVDRIYYENGKLRYEDHLEYNVSEGPSKSYYESGKIKEDSNYLNDSIHGLSKEYNENGTLKRETNYEYGVINGPVKIYNESGKLVQTKIYEQGVIKSVKNE